MSKNAMPSTKEMTKGLKVLINYKIVQRWAMFSVLIQKWPNTDSLSNQTVPYLHVPRHLLVHADSASVLAQC